MSLPHYHNSRVFYFKIGLTISINCIFNVDSRCFVIIIEVLSLKIVLHILHYIEKASDEQASLLLAEGSMLKGLNHQNICSIAYVCLAEENCERPFVITPQMNQGNLKNFLKKSRTPEGTGLEKVRNCFDTTAVAFHSTQPLCEK